MGSNSLVLNVNEEGAMMSDLATASERTGQTSGHRNMGGSMHCPLSAGFPISSISWCMRAPTGGTLIALFGHNEFFTTYRVSDSFLLSRKLWPLK